VKAGRLSLLQAATGEAANHPAGSRGDRKLANAGRSTASRP